ncbi:MAG TPA: hypothetical protein VG870_04555 [Chitinophagaceae bacterium]|nr:hypothetical protein [Chitinophagaceae bacterium]
MKRIFLTGLVTLVSCLILNAQSFSLKKWTWDTYKMEFQAPENMDVTENNADAFKASNGSITLDIYPRKGQNMTYDGMKTAIIKWADDSGLQYDNYNSYNGEKQPFYLSNLNRYSGCAIDGSKRGFPASMLLIQDPDYPDTVFYIWISYAKEYADDAVAILKSFRPI